MALRGGPSAPAARHWRGAGSGAGLTTRRAALVGEIADELGHGGVVRAVNQLPTGANLRNESCALQGLQVKCERRGNQTDAFGNGARSHSSGTLLNEQPIDRQAMLVSESTESIDHFAGLHATYDITTIIKMSKQVEMSKQASATPVANRNYNRGRSG